MRRIQLTWVRSKDDNTDRYRVYRGVRKNVTRKETLVMEVTHKLTPEPIAVTDTLKRTDAAVYQTKYKGLMPESEETPIKLFLNGTPVEDLSIDYGVDYDEGLIYFHTDFEATDIVTGSYYMDGIRVFDTDEEEQEGVIYHGPSARDRTDNTIPSNLSLLPDVNNGRITLNWADSNTQGQGFYYRVEAVDEYGNFSNLSEEQQVFLFEGLANEGYVVERSEDGTNWRSVSRQSATEYIEYGIDNDAPETPLNLQASVQLNQSQGSGDVLLAWEKPGLGLPSASAKYRVRSISALGVISSASEVVGPVYLTSEIDYYLIRRKIYDGAYPTFDGSDAVTVGQPSTLSFTDKDAPDNSIHAYSVYAVDAAGNHSLAATALAEIGDATPPDAISGISVDVHSYII